MFERIKSAIKAYFLLINMRPEAAGFMKRRSLYKKEVKETPLWIHLLLFALTLITTTIAGVLTCSKSTDLINEIFSSGLPFSLTIITILLAHEMGHYMTARHFGVKATLPYFIPFPSIIGTMGAVIKIKSPIRDKRELLYIGAMGPLIGFILSLIAFVIGLYFSEVKTFMEPGNNKDIFIFGDSIISSVLTRIIHGNIPDGHDIILSPFLWAGWIGFLVTSLNLMPMGQLDGSHILYSLVGEKQLFFGWLAFLGLIALSFIWPGWIIWIIMVLLFLMIGHPPINDGKSLSLKDRALGWTCVLIFIITFIPMPVDIISGTELDSRIYPIRCEVCSEYLEPSGITIHNNRLLFISDNRGDNAIYELTERKKYYTSEIFLKFANPENNPEFSTSYRIDIEGIVSVGGCFYLADERNRFIYKIDKDSSIEKIEHDIFEYNKKKNISFSDIENAGFEGIAFDPAGSKFFISNERKRAIVYILKKDDKSLITIDHIEMERIYGSGKFDISDLFFENGFLYLVFRRGKEIIKISPYEKKIIDNLDYSTVTDSLYNSKKGYGFAEGIYLTKEKIFLLLDSGGEKINGKKYGEHGALIVLKRPAAF